MLGTIKPTRGELMRTRKRIALAKRGHELLKRKQDSLVIEFFKLLKDVKAGHEALRSEHARAQRMMSEARALESDLTIKASALDVQKTAPIAIAVRNIAGVRVPSITRLGSVPAKPVHESLMLQDVGNGYSDVVELILLLAAKETALRKVLLEIKKTKRRANALEEVFIPELERVRLHITFELEERGREEFTRLKKRNALA